MATKVFPRRPGDWLKSEDNGFARSRDVRTVLSGQVLKCGQVCTIDSAGKAKAISATGNETHTYTFTGTPTAGYFALSLWHKDGYWVQTAPISFDASNATLDAAVEAVLGSGAAVATATGQGTAITAISLVLSGTGYASTVWPLGTVDISGVTGWTAVAVARGTSAGVARNEVQTFTFGAAATGGTLQIGVTDPVSGAVKWTDTAAWNTTDATWLAAIQTALDEICGANGIVVSGATPDSALVFTFSGTNFAGISHPFLVLDTAALTSVTTVTPVRTTAGGVAGNREGAYATHICYEAVDASAGDVAGCVFIARDATVTTDVWWGGCDPVAGAAKLATAGIIVRNEPAVQQYYG